MDPATDLQNQAAAPAYLLRFTSFYTPGRGFAVPCDEAGEVDIDSLTQRLRTAYFVARAMMGREFGYPTVVKSSTFQYRAEPGD